MALDRNSASVVTQFLSPEDISTLQEVSKSNNLVSGIGRKQDCEVEQCPFQCEFKTEKNRRFCWTHFWSWGVRFIQSMCFQLASEIADGVNDTYVRLIVNPVRASKPSWTDKYVQFIIKIHVYKTAWDIDFVTHNISRSREPTTTLLTRFSTRTEEEKRLVKNRFSIVLVSSLRTKILGHTGSDTCSIRIQIDNPTPGVQAELEKYNVPSHMDDRNHIFVLSSKSNSVNCTFEDTKVSFPNMPRQNRNLVEADPEEERPEEIKRDGHGRIVDAYGFPVDDFPPGSNKSAYAMAPEESTPGTQSRRDMRNEQAIYASGFNLHKPAQHHPGYHEETDPEKLDRFWSSRSAQNAEAQDPNERGAKRQRLSSRQYKKPRQKRKTHKK